MATYPKENKNEMDKYLEDESTPLNKDGELIDSTPTPEFVLQPREAYILTLLNETYLKFKEIPDVSTSDRESFKVKIRDLQRYVLSLVTLRGLGAETVDD